MRCKTVAFLPSQIKASECQNDISQTAHSRKIIELLTTRQHKCYRTNCLACFFAVIYWSIFTVIDCSQYIIIVNIFTLLTWMFCFPGLLEWFWPSLTLLKCECNHLCSPSLNRYSTSMIDHSYIITLFTTCFILPLGVIVFCYGKLLRKLRKVGMSSHTTDMEVIHLWNLLYKRKSEFQSCSGNL